MGNTAGGVERGEERTPDKQDRAEWGVEDLAQHSVGRGSAMVRCLMGGWHISHPLESEGEEPDNPADWLAVSWHATHHPPILINTGYAPCDEAKGRRRHDTIRIKHAHAGANTQTRDLHQPNKEHKRSVFFSGKTSEIYVEHL